jgi:DNA-binding transcriptional MocR family regulator
MSVNWTDSMSLGARRTNPAPPFLALAARTDIISFAGGVPDPAVFPVEAIGEGYGRILGDPASRAQALQYAPSAGWPPLREWIAGYMAARGVARSLGQVIVTSGAQQALDLVGKLLIDPGDLVAVTGPTFFAALDTFNPYGPRYASISFGVSGLSMEEAEAVIRRRPKFLYLNPDFQNPTGLCLSLRERELLLDLCAKHDVPILEDAAYEALRFGGEDLPPLAALAQSRGFERHVLYLNTFSKTIAPGLRVGWLAADDALIGKLTALKLSTDVHTSVLNQMVVQHVADGVLSRHMALIRRTYSARCRAMLAALDRFMPAGVRWSQPEGGLFVWLELPPEIDTSALLSRAIDTAGVAYVPGRLSFSDGQGHNTCRLTFATASEARIEEGVRRLAGLFASALRADGKDRS